MKNAKGFYDWTKILSDDKIYTIVIGAKGTGRDFGIRKIYASKNNSINKGVKNGKTN